MTSRSSDKSGSAPRPQIGRGPRIGSINVLEATIGQRGMGKSTYQCERVVELLEEYDRQAYVIGHSLGARLPQALPDGTELPIEYHKSIAALDRGLRERPTKWHILAPPLFTDARSDRALASCDDLIRYSINLSESLRQRAYQRAHPINGLLPTGSIQRYDGLPSPFVVIVVDEGIAIESAGKGQSRDALSSKDWFLHWIYSLRHYHTALLYAVQNPTARNWQILSEATRVVVFRVKHQWALNALQAAGATTDEVDEAKRLPPYEYLVLGEEERAIGPVPAVSKDKEQDNGRQGTEP